MTTTLNSLQASNVLGISEKWLRDLARDGMVPAEKEGNVWQFEFPGFVQAFVSYLRNKSDDVADTPFHTETLKKLRAEAKIKKIKAKSDELSLQVQQGELLEFEAVEQRWIEIALAIRSTFLALPQKLADALAMETDAKEIAIILDAEMRAALETLSRGEFVKPESRPEPEPEKKEKEKDGKTRGKKKAGSKKGKRA